MKTSVLKILIALIITVLVSASGAVIGIKINDAVQDTKIDLLTKSVEKLITKVDKINEFIIGNK